MMLVWPAKVPVSLGRMAWRKSYSYNFAAFLRLHYMNRIVTILVCCAGIGCSPVPKLSRTDKPVTASDNVWSTGNIAAFEKKLEELQNHYHIPSLAIGIINEKKLVVRGGLGYANIEKQTKPDENTVYQLASITKTFGSII